MKKLAHKREITIRTFDLGNHSIFVEGNFIDYPYRPKQNETSKKSELVHHILIGGGGSPLPECYFLKSMDVDFANMLYIIVSNL